jgi:glycosyltransferase involved in cell wall biosynthesis
LMLLTNAFDPDPRVHQEAKALVGKGYSVTILCWDRDEKAPFREIVDGIKIERIYARSTHGRGVAQMVFLFLFWLKTLTRALFSSFQVVHCHDFDTLPLGYLLAKTKRAKLVYDSHESYVDMLVNVPAALKALICRAENLLLKRVDLVITVGEILKQSLEKRGAKRACVVGNWKNPEEYQFPAERIAAEKNILGIHNGQLVASFIANLGPERQLPQLIEAVKDMPNVFLILGGGGPTSDLADTAADRFSNIHYLGYVHPSRIPLYTAMSDAIFYGFDPKNPNARFSAPNKLFEALSAGKALITGDFGEIGKITKEEKSGIVLKDYSIQEITNALGEVTPSIAEEMGRRGKKAALRTYSWKKAAQELLKAYENLK